MRTRQPPIVDMMSRPTRLAGVELGGTKSIAVLCVADKIIDRLTVATTDPAETLDAIRRQLLAWQSIQSLDGLGIASFGPIRLDRTKDDFGTILTTPKPGWKGAQVVFSLADGVKCPIALDTDVNAAAVAEYRWGAGQACSSLVYITIGTGLGGGVLFDGEPIHGFLHPEIGHILVRRRPEDRFAGACPFHGDCIEGLISGPALAKRFGASPDQVLPDHPEWENAAHDLAHLFATLISTFAPQRILVGGGVGEGAPRLITRAMLLLPALLGEYYAGVGPDETPTFIQRPQLGTEAGPLGAIALAEKALLAALLNNGHM